MRWVIRIVGGAAGKPEVDDVKMVPSGMRKLVLSCKLPAGWQVGEWRYLQPESYELILVSRANSLMQDFDKRFVVSWDPPTATYRLILPRAANTSDSGLYICYSGAGPAATRLRAINLLVPSQTRFAYQITNIPE